MIEYTASIIERIIQYIHPMEVLSGGVCAEQISMERLQKICFVVEDNKSEPSIEKSLEYLADWVEKELCESGRKSEDREKNQEEGRKIDFFDLINCFSSKVLTTVNEKLVFKYKYLESWHQLSSKEGSDLFVASEYAFHDTQFGIQRKSFLWDTVLGHDNYSLNCILNKKISDNHYHLRASTPYFDLSWISLMNSANQTSVFKYMNQMNTNSRNVKKQYVTEKPNEKYEHLHLKALLIRVYLYSVLTDRLIQLADYKVSIKWLLEHIIDTENPNRYLQDMNWKDVIQTKKYSVNIKEGLEECLEKDGITQIRKNCSGLYWFFWERFSDIPMSILADTNSFICPDNVIAISDYIENIYSELLLQSCEWLFTGRYFEKYKMEWKYQTHSALYRILQDSYELIASRKYIQSVLDGIYLSRTWMDKDYMLNEVETATEKQWENSVLSGERWFLYTMFYNKYLPIRRDLEDRNDLYDLFFAYLIIKERFRRELLYNNDKIGFNNFHTYQKRKTWFTTSFTEAQLARIAVRGAFNSCNLKSLELRIMPADTSTYNIMTIQTYDEAIGKDLREKYYYVFHFGREKEKHIQPKCSLKYRNEDFCEKLKRRTDAILIMREKNRQIGKRLLGVDACSSEDGCRPEVFAVAFRVLKKHIVEEDLIYEKMPQLRLSYHVGEDNQDVLDGIRAIDEAIFFLNMGSGDRLGHATMLGVDAAEWYYKNNYRISIRQQDYLDNVVWLYQIMIYYHLPNEDNLLEYLEREFHTYFECIYRYAIDIEYPELESKDFDIHNYYASWELRGDDPKLYKSGRYEKPPHYITIWDDNSINDSVDKDKRNMQKATILYHAYHYSGRVREEGNKAIVKKIPFHMVRGIQAVQRKMMQKIAKKGIAIETNPSSNVLIAGLDSYGNHPIVTFYNKGLTDDYDELDKCSQISVSINTDDLGVFMTSLKNEYALMAKSLESMRDKEGNYLYKKDMVYDWIDSVRKMGNKQRFSKNNE